MPEKDPDPASYEPLTATNPRPTSPPPASLSPSPPPPPSTPSPTYTIDEAISHIGTGRFQYLICALTGLCWTAESMEMLLLSFIKAPLQCDWSISDARAALITTAVGLGMLSGSTVWGLVADRTGRRPAFILSNLVTFLAGIASALAPTYPFLLLARAAVGFGIGGVPVSFSLFMEFLPARSRGSWGIAVAVFWSLGAIFESLVAMFILPRYGWRWLIAISSLPLLLVLLATLFVAESPRWLITHGKLEAAQQVIHSVALTNRTTLPPGTLALPQPPPSSESTPIRGPRRFGQIGLLLRRGARSLAFKIWLVWFAAAFVYYGLITLQPELIANENIGTRCSYAQRECAAKSSAAATCTADPICLWKPAAGAAPATCALSGTHAEEGALSAACKGQLTRADFISTLWASVGEVPGLFVAFSAIDLIGRRPLLGYMFGGVASCFVILLACIGRVAESALFFAARGLSSGSFQTIYLYTNELYPSVIRTTAMGLASSMARIGLICTPFVSQYLVNWNHAAAMWIYFGVAALAVLGVVLIPIETTGRPMLSSMDELIDDLRLGTTPGTEPPVLPTFAKDPSVSWVVRFFRWRAPVDGGISM